MAEDKNTRVECYSGSRVGARPLAFLYEGRRHTVAAVIRQWRIPEGLCYRVITDEELRFDLIYLEDEDAWDVIPLE